MRGLQISLNHTQKIRLQKAREMLESLSSKANSDASVIVADTIPLNYEYGVLKGHGTLDLNGEVVAAICGVIERVNKLIYIKLEVGDIVVEHVSEVASKRWRLDINYSQDAVLMLSSMSLPDGIQLLTVSPYLVKRCRQHSHHLEQYGIDLILGCNRFIWIGEHVDPTEDMMIEDQVDKSEQKGSKFEETFGNQVQERVYTPLEIRQNICRTANAIRVLSILGFIITVEVIMETVSLSISVNMNVHEMLGSEFFVLTAEKEVERRTSSKKRG